MEIQVVAAAGSKRLLKPGGKAALRNKKLFPFYAPTGIPKKPKKTAKVNIPLNKQFPNACSPKLKSWFTEHGLSFDSYPGTADTDSGVATKRGFSLAVHAPRTGRLNLKARKDWRVFLIDKTIGMEWMGQGASLKSAVRQLEKNLGSWSSPDIG